MVAPARGDTRGSATGGVEALGLSADSATATKSPEEFMLTMFQPVAFDERRAVTFVPARRTGTSR
jgi:hypothetical protein